jgi:tRNA nucleotidyltransferase/poly(A) polymerase
MELYEIKKFLSGYGKVKEVFISNTHDKFALPILIFRAGRDEIETQITLPRGGDTGTKADPTGTLRQDAKHRDFTINAMYLPISKISPHEVIDFSGDNGIRDIKGKVIEAVGNAKDRIRESPVRIMRAFSLSARLDYKISPKLLDAIRELKELLVLVSPENIRDELNEILVSSKPSEQFKLMLNTGVLAIIMPELYRCSGVTQDARHHKFDVFTHCITTCDFIEPNLVLRLAAILHDTGKFTTRNEVSDGTQGPSRITFHNHELFSVKYTQAFMERLKYDKKTINEVVNLVKYHMYHYTSGIYHCSQEDCFWAKPTNNYKKKPDYCPKCGAPIEVQTGWTDAAVRRFITKIGINSDNIEDLGSIPLFKLRAAERLGNGLKKIAVTDRQLDFQKRIVEVFKNSKGLTVGDLDIDGNVIMETFRLKPGQKIGKILKFLLQKVLENPSLNNRFDLLKLATKFIFIKKDLKDVDKEEWTRRP